MQGAPSGSTELCLSEPRISGCLHDSEPPNIWGRAEQTLWAGIQGRNPENTSTAFSFGGNLPRSAQGAQGPHGWTVQYSVPLVSARVTLTRFEGFQVHTKQCLWGNIVEVKGPLTRGVSLALGAPLFSVFAGSWNGVVDQSL